MFYTEFQNGVRDGAKDAVKDTVIGIWDAATNPLETFKGTWYSATHPIQTFNVIKNALVQSFDKDIVHGNAYTRSRWITYAFTTLAAAVVGTKGVDKISKVAKAGKIGEAASKAHMVTKTTLAKHTESVNNKLNRWSTPLFPSTQFANGPIPYNVIDTKGLRNKLQQLPNRNEQLTNQIDRVRDLIQEASIKKYSTGNRKIVHSVSNMNEFFKTDFGKSIINGISKTKMSYDGQSIYKITHKIDSDYLKKGYGLYLDALHHD
ncbi:MAG: hypothetical protein K0S24_4930, partial [Sphingobacterium sp.]|nr:hypothetical protein [Sphingobacterium sp.]